MVQRETEAPGSDCYGLSFSLPVPALDDVEILRHVPWVMLHLLYRLTVHDVVNITHPNELPLVTNRAQYEGHLATQKYDDLISQLY